MLEDDGDGGGDGGGKDPNGGGTERCVLHLDLDSFFLSVHARNDPALTLDARPAVLWQYQDVICANRPARTLGVRKHMRPADARKIVSSGDGILLHAYSRSWPGPRVRYGPYNAASREFFAALDGALRAEAGGDPRVPSTVAAVERGSIDEAFVALSPPPPPVGLPELCSRLRARIESSTGLRVTVGCGPNKLLAKLASSAAKGTAAAVRVIHGRDEVEGLLRTSPASRLPGLGRTLPPGVKTITDLRRYDGSGQGGFHLGEKLLAKCYGMDDAPLNVSPPMTAQVASWTAHTDMSSLCRRVGGGSNGASHSCPTERNDATTSTSTAISFPSRRGGGRWLFEPHGAAAGSTNKSRPRWVVLALAIDLEERLRHDAALHRRRPTRLTVSVRSPGKDPLPLPGSDYMSGGSRSQSTPFPRPLPCPPREAAALAAAIRRGIPAGEAAEDTPLEAYGRIHALADAVCSVLEQWAGEAGDPRVAHLTLSAGRFEAGRRPIAAFLGEGAAAKKRPRPVLTPSIPPTHVCPARPPSSPNAPPPAPARVHATARSPPSRRHGDFSGIDGRDVDPTTLAELPPTVRAEVEQQLALFQSSQKRPARQGQGKTRKVRVTGPTATMSQPAPAGIGVILKMGFELAAAQRALAAAGGDIEQAINHLLGGD